MQHIVVVLHTPQWCYKWWAHRDGIARPDTMHTSGAKHTSKCSFSLEQCRDVAAHNGGSKGAALCVCVFF